MSTTSSSLDIVRCWSGGGFQNTVWNWGDAISPTIYNMIVGRFPRTIDYPNMTVDPHLIMCGSTLRWITNGSVIWGTGAMDGELPFVAGSPTPLHVAAVRGPLTRRRLVEAGISCPEVYGDPALLFPRFYRPAIERSYRIGFIPHYIDADLPMISHLRMLSGVRIIDITQSKSKNKVFDFVDEVLSCDRIVSSSLHGLIAAEAYGIPSCWAQLSSNVVGRGFKFRDYFLSTGRDPDAQGPIGDLSDIEAVIQLIDHKFSREGGLNFDADKLLAAFPKS